MHTTVCVENVYLQNPLSFALHQIGHLLRRSNQAGTSVVYLNQNINIYHVPCIFCQQDKNRDGSITHAEFLKGLRENPWVAELLGKY